MGKKLWSGLVTIGCITTMMLAGCEGVKTDGDAAGTVSNEGIASTKNPYEDNVKIAFICNDIASSIGSAWAQGMEEELRRLEM